MFSKGKRQFSLEIKIGTKNGFRESRAWMEENFLDSYFIGINLPGGEKRTENEARGREEVVSH